MRRRIKEGRKSKKVQQHTNLQNWGKQHHSKAKGECWELEKNKVSHPSMWKLTKST
jgi:hypothetical protein